MRTLVCALLCAFVSGSALATTTSASPPAGTRNVAPPKSASAAAAHADDTSGLRGGSIQSVDMGKGTFRVYGQTVEFNPRDVRVYSKGAKASVFTLKPGARVRFTMDPKDPKKKRAGTIYVE